MATSAVSPNNQLLLDLARDCVADPLQFVCCAYTWGEGILAGESGPDSWQVEVLDTIKAQLLDPTHEGALKIGIASGHGIGKGALCAWLLHWFITTRAHPQIVVTANTQAQLLTKTWREVAKWHAVSHYRDWFTWTKTAYYKNGAEASWFAAAIPWNEAKPEAFQGAHDKYVMILLDEASAIPDIIFDTIEGSMTTPQALWVQCGNPTRNQGRFKEIFPGGRFAHRWWTRQIDSRTCKKADQGQIRQWIEDYGEDSDFVRVRVKGQFPRAGSTQYIGDDIIAGAQRRLPVPDATAPLVIGVDVARFGDDRSVVLVRQGPLLLGMQIYRERSTVDVAGYLIAAIDQYSPQAVFIDCDGLGAGVYDQVASLGAVGGRVYGSRAVYGDTHLYEVHSGAQASDPEHYMNKRAEMWARCKEWLTHRGQLTYEHGELIGELTAIEYGYDMRGRLQMEQKKDMKKRGLASPDLADSLVLSFAETVAPRALPPPREESELDIFTVAVPGGGSWMG